MAWQLLIAGRLTLVIVSLAGLVETTQSIRNLIMSPTVSGYSKAQEPPSSDVGTAFIRVWCVCVCECVIMASWGNDKSLCMVLAVKYKSSNISAMVKISYKGLLRMI